VRKLLGQAMQEVDAAGHPREAHSARDHDRGAERRRHGRRAGARGRVLQHRNERSHPVHARHRPRQPLDGLSRLALSPRHPAHDPPGVAAAAPTAFPSRSAAPWRATRLPPCCSSGLGLRELSMEAAAIPEIKEALRGSDERLRARGRGRARHGYGRGRRRAHRRPPSPPASSTCSRRPRTSPYGAEPPDSPREPLQTLPDVLGRIAERAPYPR
jgi:hypothetical protein